MWNERLSVGCGMRGCLSGVKREFSLLLFNLTVVEKVCGYGVCGGGEGGKLKGRGLK